MISKRLWMLLRYGRRIGVRISLMALLAVLAAAAAWLLEDVIPRPLSSRFGEDAVMPVLNILATSMLAVVTFSLSVMVAAYRSASAEVTPRVHRLLLEDTTSQMVLATFLGAFIFSLVAIILFRAGFYGERASVIVFGVAAAVVVAVVLAILRWIDHLSRFGSLDTTLAELETRVGAALSAYRRQPGFGATPLPPGESPPRGAAPVAAPATGFVRHIDLPRLDGAARGGRCRIYLSCAPGAWVAEGEAFAVADSADPAIAEAVRAAVTLDAVRDYDQDPRFGLCVLAEIASRALSPGINDSGTAIDVIGRLERVLTAHGPGSCRLEAPDFPHVHVPVLPEAALVEAAFGTIARDGAGRVEVAAFLQGALRRLAARRDPDLGAAARDMAGRAMAHAEAALGAPDDIERLRAAAG